MGLIVFSLPYLCVTELLVSTFRQIHQFILVVTHFIVSDTFQTGVRYVNSCTVREDLLEEKVFSLM